MKPQLRVSLLAALALALAACSNTPAPTPVPVQPSPSAYPVGPGTVYPPPKVTPTPCNVPAIKFDTTPLAAGATSVTGTGPAGLPITIDSVMNMGRQLGSGTIGADSHFTIEVVALEVNDFVGLRLGDLTSTNFKPETFLNDSCYHGPGQLLVPQVGFFFDTANVK
jgi:hypothetical protein